MSELIAVYVLTDDERGEIRYVGVSKRPHRRLGQHIREARKGRTHRHRWVNSLLKRGICPRLTVVEWVSADRWDEAERRWIAAARAEGCELVNGNDGGTTMHQARATSCDRPAIRHALRTLEGATRSLDRLNSPEALSRAKTRYAEVRAAVDRCRKAGTLDELERRLAATIRLKPRSPTHEPHRATAAG